MVEAGILPLELTQLKYSELVVNVESLLGGGAYGEVYRAKADQLPCAAKYFSCEDTPELDIIRMEQQLQLMSSIKHPNLVQCLGTAWDCSKGRPILLTELLEESLTLFLDRQKTCLPYYVRVNIFHDVALAVCYLHKNGFIHGDLTSNNVLIVGESRAKVTDYWMYRLYEVNKKMQHFAHVEDKLAYIAPELQSNPMKFSPKSDSFSFGVIVTKVDLPNHSNSSHGNEDKMINLPRNSSFLPLAQKCLMKSAEARPQFECICHDLEVLKDDVMYAKSIQDTREEKVTLQQHFHKKADNMEVMMHEIERKVKRKEKESEWKTQVVSHLLTEIESLKQQLHSQESTDEVDDGPEYRNAEDNSGILQHEELEFSETLSESKTAVIFRGIWHTNNIAFKRLCKHQTKPEKWQRRLEHEIMTLSQLSHPNIVRIYGATLLTSKTGIVMELLTISLYYALFSADKHNSLPSRKKKRIVRQIASGLEYLHDQNIVHCNLSSGNVFLSDQGVAKLGNYGPKCARMNSESNYHMVGDTSGCFCYSAPEILQKDILLVRELKMADTYSLATVAYEVLSGKHSFREGISEIELTNEVVIYNARPLLEGTQISEPVKEILTKCWDVNPNSRLSAHDFVAQWIMFS